MSDDIARLIESPTRCLTAGIAILEQYLTDGDKGLMTAENNGRLAILSGSLAYTLKLSGMNDAFLNSLRCSLDAAYYMGVQASEDVPMPDAFKEEGIY